MLHGFLGSPASSFPLASYLAERGVTVHCPLLPGHGEFPNKLYKRTRDDWLGEAEDAFHEIQRTCDEIILMGHSMGTVLCAEMAVRHGGVQGMIMFAPAYTVPDSRIRLLRFIKYVMPWFNPLRMRRLKPLVNERLLEFDAEMDLKDPEVVAKLPEMARVPTGAIDEMRRTLDEGQKLWPQLNFPSIVFQGSEDYAVHPPDTQHLFDLLPAVDKQLIFLENSGHELMRPSDAGHKKVWSAAADFIYSHTSLEPEPSKP
jgi:carboxylesterase